ncbi:hypothetical protein [Streptomyces fuscigenes]|uniref:hypothetical protein n=1 Tax=Streptomyces fuscigenes TaxID=1528880 RepID=UPI001F3A86CA|nr:hypothetical protein [Streptomyces fuscigenes]MCF3960595.1 hypothetical protein [Streptomyces fuscigenes]
MDTETGIPAVDALLVWGGAISLAGGLVAVAWRVLRGTARLGRRVDEFIDDWRGEPSRPGVPARPGVMERMVGLESRMGGVEDELGRIKHELYPNSGGSLRDAVDLANHRLSRLCEEQPGTAVPAEDMSGDTESAPGDIPHTAGDTSEDAPTVSGEDTAEDGPGDTGDTGPPGVPAG